MGEKQPNFGENYEKITLKKSEKRLKSAFLYEPHNPLLGISSIGCVLIENKKKELQKKRF